MRDRNLCCQKSCKMAHCDVEGEKGTKEILYRADLRVCWWMFPDDLIPFQSCCLQVHGINFPLKPEPVQT